MSGTSSAHIRERILLGRRDEESGWLVHLVMQNADLAYKAQRRCPLISKFSVRDGIAKHVVHPPNLDRFRCDGEGRAQQAQSVAIARAEHHSVAAEGDRL